MGSIRRPWTAVYALRVSPAVVQFP